MSDRATRRYVRADLGQDRRRSLNCRRSTRRRSDRPHPRQRLNHRRYAPQATAQATGPRFWMVRPGQSFCSIAANTAINIITLEQLNPQLNPPACNQDIASHSAAEPTRRPRPRGSPRHWLSYPRGGCARARYDGSPIATLGRLALPRRGRVRAELSFVLEAQQGFFPPGLSAQRDSPVSGCSLERHRRRHEGRQRVIRAVHGAQRPSSCRSPIVVVSAPEQEPRVARGPRAEPVPVTWNST
jgi:hypothetical protein